ncbi:NIPSNAP family protein [Alkalibacillus aidingensis]|uniref:NIPSNAP family protein n=1 Tax=Alkalibacillus aidingensis TaxID=2747607 RepID=UPI001661055D|nr:NIPSNAP family protein [Alkalibacillus aidingensis]
MFYRRKSYHVHKDFVQIFNEHFNERLLPTQLKYGAKLVGRWMTKETNGVVEIFAIWQYDSYGDYIEIEGKVRSDQAHVERVKNWYQKHGGRDFVLKHCILEARNEEIFSTVKDGNY